MITIIAIVAIVAIIAIVAIVVMIKCPGCTPSPKECVSSARAAWRITKLKRQR